MISTACFITYFFEWISAFELAVEWTVKDSLKDSLLPHWLTARLEPAGEISTEKVLLFTSLPVSMQFSFGFWILYIVTSYIWRIGDNTTYRAFEPLKITAREIPEPRQPYL